MSQPRTAAIRQLTVAVLLIGLDLGGGVGQVLPARDWMREDGRVRVVYPPTYAIDSTTLELLGVVLDRSLPVAGIPGNVLADETITISIATEPWRDVGAYARSSPVQRLVILPAQGIVEWDRKLLARVLRHELAHIALGIYLNYAPIPVWIEEGFAAWASGGIDCAGSIRISLDIMARDRQNLPLRGLPGRVPMERSALAYDYLSTFFHYIDGTWPEIVSDGRLWNSVRVHGLDAGVARLLGSRLAELERSWQEHVRRVYGGPLKVPLCE